MTGAYLFLGLLLVPAATGLEPLSDVELVDRAAMEFQEAVAARSTPGKARDLFARAATKFEDLRRHGYHSPALYRNQGNAYMLAGDLPRAILAYRRGLRLSPGDPGLLANLNYAREQVASPANGPGRPPASIWPAWLPRFGPGPLFYGIGGCYGLVCLGLTRWWMIRQTWCLALAGSAFLLANILAAGLIIELAEQRQEARHPVVVVARDGVILRKGNGRSYPASIDFPLVRGVEARWLFARGDWLQIELAGGEVGWVPRADALEDGP